MKWLTSGSHRLKANLNRSFGARKTKKAAAVAARKHDVRFKSILSSDKAAKSTRLRIARSKAITRTEQLDDKPVMLPSEMHIDSHRPPTAVATTMNPLQLRNHMPFGEHNESSRAQLIAQRKEELIQPYFTRNRTPASNVAHYHAVHQHRLQHDLFGVDSIDRIVNGFMSSPTRTHLSSSSFMLW